MLKKLLIVVMCIALLGFIGVGCKTEAAPSEEAMEEEADDGIIGDLYIFIVHVRAEDEQFVESQCSG